MWSGGRNADEQPICASRAPWNRTGVYGLFDTQKLTKSCLNNVSRKQTERPYETQVLGLSPV